MWPWSTLDGFHPDLIIFSPAVESLIRKWENARNTTVCWIRKRRRSEVHYGVFCQQQTVTSVSPCVRSATRKKKKRKKNTHCQKCEYYSVFDDQQNHGQKCWLFITVCWISTDVYHWVGSTKNTVRSVICVSLDHKSCWICITAGSTEIQPEVYHTVLDRQNVVRCGPLHVGSKKKKIPL